jgi:hypothetical protein
VTVTNRDETVEDSSAVVGVRRFAVVEFDGRGRRVRRVVTMFASELTAELFAVEHGMVEYAVAPASILVSLRE